MSTPIWRAYQKALKVRDERGWDSIYILVDLHGTVLNSNWSDTELPNEYYPHSIEVLSFLSKAAGVTLILWTSSHLPACYQYKDALANKGVTFKYINCNPEVETDPNGYGCFDRKPYFNLILDDKAGFEPETDWLNLRTLLGA